MLIALSGRSIDALNAKEPRFLLANVELVRMRMRFMFQAQAANVLVYSTACGANLITLVEAYTLGSTCRIVLPSDREEFRQRSVVDRPRNWGSTYCQVNDRAYAAGSLILINQVKPEPDYFLGTQAILDEAAAVAGKLGIPAGATLIWSRSSRRGNDVTGEFGDEARKSGMCIVEAKTL
jgi:transposase